MPKYLAKAYLSEYINHHMLFMSKSLLVTPTNQTDNARQINSVFENMFYKELKKEELNKSEIFEDSNVVQYNPLENYNVSVPSCSTNIIEIDSDSDLGISSSFGSSGNLEHDIINNIFHESICSTAMKELDHTQDFFLDEFESEHDNIANNMPIIESLCKKLRPVAIKDPFHQNVLKGFKDKQINKLEGQPVVDSPTFNFSKIKFSLEEDKEFLLEESVVIDFLKPEENIFKETLIELSCEAIDENSLFHDFKNLIDDDVVVIEKFEMENVLPKIDDFTPHILVEECGQKLESPVSDVILLNDHFILDVAKERKNDDNFEDEQKIETLEILSPHHIKEIQRNMRKEEGTFSYLLLMLLTVPELKHDVTQLPTLNMKNLISDLFCEKTEVLVHLNWDPISYSSCLINNALMSLVCSVEKSDCFDNEVITVKDFKKVEVEDKESPEELEDWKLQEKKIHSFQYIASFDKPTTGIGIPSVKNQLKAPKGYHNNQIVKEKSKILPKKSSDTILDLSCITPQLTQIFQSPLDSFIAMRTGQVPRKSVALVKPVSAAKVRPMVNESLNKKQKMNNSLKQHEDNHKKLHTSKYHTPHFSAIRNQPEITDDSGFCSTVVPNDLAENLSSTNKNEAGLSSTSSYGGNAQTNNGWRNDGTEGCGNSAGSEGGINGSGVNSNNFENIEDSDFIYEVELDIPVNQALPRSCSGVTFHENMFSDKKVHKVTPSSNNNKDKNKGQSIIDQCNVSKVLIENLNNSQHQAHSQDSTLKSKHVIKDIQLTDEYTKLIKTIVEESSSLLQFLKDVSRIDSKCCLFTLSHHVTRFMLKEEEKKMKSGNSEQDILRGVVCLHGLSKSIHLLRVYDVSTACCFLKLFNAKYENALRGCLEPVRQKILCHGNILHPKYIEIKTLIQHWLQKSNDLHVLILVADNFETLSASLLKYITQADIKVNLYPTMECNEQVYTNTFVEPNVILAHKTKVLEACPWQFFQYIIQYDFSEDSWYDIVIKQNPDLSMFITLKTNHINQPVTGSAMESCSTEMQHTILCSQDIVSNKELLVRLESKENIQILVKDYPTKLSTSLPQPDILIDERTTVVLVNGDQTSKENGRMIQLKIISSVMKSLVCHIVLIYDEKFSSSEKLSLTTAVASVLSQIKHSFTSVRCKLWHVHTTDHLSLLLRQLCDDAYKCCTVWTKEQWISRNWITEDISQQEMFLLSYPCMNSFCAQIMLQACKSLEVLMKLTLEDLTSVFTWIPDIFLKSFHKTNHYIPFNNNNNNNNMYHQESIVVDDDDEQNFADASFYCESHPVEKQLEPIEDILSRENSILLPQDLSLAEERISGREIVFNHEGNNNDFLGNPDSVLNSLYQQQNDGMLDNQVAFHREKAKPSIMNRNFINNVDVDFNLMPPCNAPSLFQSFNTQNLDEFPVQNSLQSSFCQTKVNRCNTEKLQRQFIDLNDMHHLVPEVDQKHSNKENSLRNACSKRYKTSSVERGTHHLEKVNVDRNGSYSNHVIGNHNFLTQQQNNKVLNSFPNDPSQFQTNDFSKPYRTFEENQNIRSYNNGFHERNIYKRPTVQSRTSYVNKNIDVTRSFNNNNSPHQLVTPPKSNMKHQYSNVPISLLSLSASKKRRLAYEKVPGATNGQTRLTFR